MFRKNLIEFFIGLDSYLYYFYSGCTISPWSHALPECSMITWPCHMTLVPTLFISQPHCMSWGFGSSVQMLRKLFPFWGSHNTLYPWDSVFVSGSQVCILFFTFSIYLVFVSGSQFQLHSIMSDTLCNIFSYMYETLMNNLCLWFY